MTEYNFNFKNSIFTKQAIKAAKDKAVKKDVQDSIASSNEVKNLLEQKCDNAGIFRDLTDEEVEARMNAEDQSPLKLIKNLINNKHKDSSGVNYATNQRNVLNEKDSSGVLPPQNDAFRHTEQSEVSQSIQGDGEILRHFVPQNDVLPTAGAVEDSETVLIPNDGDSEVSQQLVTEYTPESVDSGISQQLVTSFTPTPTPTPVENRTNATSSLTIKDADGAKPQTLAAGDKLNVTYVYEDKTFNYTIEAKSTQNVTLQTKDGYFTVVGDNLAVQTGDEQYSFVALIGTTNSIKIGTNGKTYNGNSIAYNSDEGGHSVYTWGDTPEPKADYKMSRGETKTITVTQEEQILELTNPFDNTKHYYTLKVRDDITPASNSAVNFTQQSVKFQFLANGRLVVTGSYVDIEAMDGQKDDLIILGHFNNIKTGDMDDIIRVGYVADNAGKDYILNSACATNEKGEAVTTYNNAYGRIFGETKAYCAVGNHISSGDGNDHVSVLATNQDNVTTADLGRGYDTFANSSGLKITLSDTQLSKIKNAEIVSKYWFSPEYIETSGTSLLDGDDGWARQGSIDDCVFLTAINSLRLKGKNLSDYVNIMNDGQNYTVKFFKYNPEVWGTQTNTVTFPMSDVDAYKGVYGDPDTIIADIAINKLFEINKDGGYTNVNNGQKGELSRYLYGNNYYYYGNITKDLLLKLWNKYESDIIDNLFIIYVGDDYSIGRHDHHAYCLKSISTYKENDSEELYIELINPWDDRDCVRYNLDEFLSWPNVQQIKFRGFDPNIVLAD